MRCSAARRWVAVALAAVLVSAGVADVAAAVNVAGDGAVVAPVDASQLPALESRPAPPTVLAPLLPGASDELPPTASKVDDPDALSGGDRESSFDAQRSVPVEGLTSPTQEVFKNPDSTYTARVSPNPVRFQDNKGEWIDIDLDFVADASGALRAKASGLPVVIAADGSKDLVQVGLAQGPVVMGVPDVARDLGRVEAKNGRAVFAAANESDPKVRVDLTVDGFEQDLVLASTDGPSSYRLPFTLPDGVSAKQGATAVEFVDGAGVTVASFGGGVAYDSVKDGIDGRSSATGVSTRLVSAAGPVVTVEVSVDPEWLRNSKRVAPVVIDPSFSVSGSSSGSDTYVQTSVSTPQGSSIDLISGVAWPYGQVAHSLVKFDLTSQMAPERWVTSAG